MKSHKHKMLAVICLSILLVFSLGSWESLAADIVSSGMFGPSISWTLDSEGVMRVDGSGSNLMYWFYDGMDEEIETNREEHDAIREAALSANTIIIGEGITSIGNSMEGGPFRRCPNLRKVVLPASLIVIEGLDNNPLLSEVVIPADSRATSVGEDAFVGCTSLKSLDLPEGITSIAGAFGETGIKSITIPASVTNMGGMLYGTSISEVIYLPKKVNNNTFYGSNAETIVFGENLSSIAGSAFENCEGLRNVVFLNDYDYNSKLFENLSDVMIYRKQGSKSVTLEEASSGTKNVSVPSKIAGYSVTKIGEYAFDSNKYVKTVKLPSSITKIEGYAFYNCSKLSKITMSEGITSIAKFAFYGCNSLTSITLPSTLTSIGERAFWNCYSLTTLTIPPSVSTIGANAFESCTSLTSITIGESGGSSVSEVLFPAAYAGSSSSKKYITIKKNAFSKCKNLKKVVIGSKVKSLGSKAFYKCGKLKTITIKTKKLKTSTVGSSAFKGIYKKATFKLPKSKLKAYKKILLKKGATKKMKYKGV